MSGKHSATPGKRKARWLSRKTRAPAKTALERRLEALQERYENELQEYRFVGSAKQVNRLRTKLESWGVVVEHSVKVRLDYNMTWGQLTQEVEEAGIPSHARVSAYKYNAGNDPREASYYTDLTFTWGNASNKASKDNKSANGDRTVIL